MKSAQQQWPITVIIITASFTLSSRIYWAEGYFRVGWDYTVKYQTAELVYPKCFEASIIYCIVCVLWCGDISVKDLCTFLALKPEFMKPIRMIYDLGTETTQHSSPCVLLGQIMKSRIGWGTWLKPNGIIKVHSRRSALFYLFIYIYGDKHVFPLIRLPLQQIFKTQCCLFPLTRLLLQQIF